MEHKVKFKGQRLLKTYICTMAGPAAMLTSIGDLVTTENRLCYVEKVDNTLGYNQYTLVDIDSGVSLIKSRYQFQHVDLDMLTEGELNVDIENLDGKKKEETIEKEKRFTTVSTEEIDALALNRTSQRTKSQTNWAVSIFKGK